MLFYYEKGQLIYHGLALRENLSKICKILNEKFFYQGPFYLYHGPLFLQRAELLVKNLPQARFYYSVKSLSNIHLLKILAKIPQFGADVVSVGELYRALKAGFPGNQIVFAGVGKSYTEIKTALQNKIHCFHVESLSELKRIAELAQSMQAKAPVALRLNPNVVAKTHHHIITGKDENKFGISKNEVKAALQMIKQNHSVLEFLGFHAHIGSQIQSVRPYLDTIKYLLKQAQKAELEFGLKTNYLSLGGGFGVNYSLNKGKEFSLSSLEKKLSQLKLPAEVNFEPGRFISAVSGILICQVEYLKQKKNYEIAILNAGMNDLIRPALYTAIHPILPIEIKSKEKKRYDLVGPICESADTFARKIKLPKLQEGDFVVIAHAGAYGSVMGSNYNTRPLLPEILYDGKDFQVIRRPQSYEEIFSLELDIN